MGLYNGNNTLLEEIDRLHDKIVDGGLESCLNKIYNAINGFTMQETVSLDDDNAPHADIILPNFRKATEFAKEHYNGELDRKSTRLNSSHVSESRMPSSA